jgi:primary-amine oxidase
MSTMNKQINMSSQLPALQSRRWQPDWFGVRLIGLLAILLVGSAALFWRYAPVDAQPGANCSAPYLVDQTFANGARWQLCWEHRSLDGIVLRDIYFTPPGGTARRVLSLGSIAQVHVPYDDNSARFHDVTDDGFGDTNLNDLTAADCPDGVLLKHGAKDAVCQQRQSRGYAFNGLGMQEQGELLSLFSVSTSGEYNYIPVWRFGDDGSMELLMGAAGKLQRFTTDRRYGWPVRANSTLGTSHIHNYYWRLDFDLGETAEDDVVEEFNYTPAAGGQARQLGVSQLTGEAARSIDPTGLRSWQIRDAGATGVNGRSLAYGLEPITIAHRDVGPSYEPWTANDFYVTRYRECERYASHNPTLNGCADNLAGFVNGESLEGADLVLWYGLTFHHIPRDEDEPFMHVHWSGFRLTPRDWMAAHPSAADLVTCAVGDVTCDDQTDAADALFMLQYDVRLRASSDQVPPPEGTLYGYSCDVSGEGACNAVDALLTLQCSVGRANRFCPASGGIQAITQANTSAAPVLVTVGESQSQAQGVLRVPLRLATATAVGALSATLAYDPAIAGTVECVGDPAEHFALEACQVDPAEGVVRLSLVSDEGVVGEMIVGELVIAADPDATNVPQIDLTNTLAAAPDGGALPVQTGGSELNERHYLPLIVR